MKKSDSKTRTRSGSKPAKAFFQKKAKGHFFSPSKKQQAKKKKVERHHDPYEREADQVAHQIVDQQVQSQAVFDNITPLRKSNPAAQPIEASGVQELEEEGGAMKQEDLAQQQDKPQTMETEASQEKEADGGAMKQEDLAQQQDEPQTMEAEASQEKEAEGGVMKQENLAQQQDEPQTMEAEASQEKEAEGGAMKQEDLAQQQDELQTMEAEGGVMKQENLARQQDEPQTIEAEASQEKEAEGGVMKQEDLAQQQDEPQTMEAEASQEAEGGAMKQEDLAQQQDEPQTTEEEANQEAEGGAMRQEDPAQQQDEPQTMEAEASQEKEAEGGVMKQEDLAQQQDEPQTMEAEGGVMRQEDPAQQQDEPQTMEAEASQEKEEVIQGKNRFGAASGKLVDLMKQAKGKGSPLPESIRTEMETGFGADFSPVRIHTGADAVMMNKQMKAQAFAQGKDIFFNQGKFDPNSKKGRQLLAHELTHTVQQGAVTKQIPRESIAPGSESEGLNTAEAVPNTSGTKATSTKDDKLEQPPESTEITPSAEGETKNPETEAEQQETSTTPDQTLQDTPRSAAEDPNFQALEQRSESTAKAQIDHPASAGIAANAQAASPSPSNERESIAQVGQVNKMEQQEAGTFDADAFVEMLLTRIKEVMPTDEKEADEFKDSGKMEQVKNSATTQVESEKQNTAGNIEEATTTEPNTEAVPERVTVPLEVPAAGTAPKGINPSKAMPPKRQDSEVKDPLIQENEKVADKMTEAEVTDEQLAKSNEPAFTSALESKHQAQEHTDAAPTALRAEEETVLQDKQNQSEVEAQQQLAAMHGDRQAAMLGAATDQTQTGTKDNSERAKIAKDIDGIYEKTKTEVETTLASLDESVNSNFEAGNQRATRQFEDYVERKMDEYKEERYGAWFDPRGWGTRLADAVVGLPDEVNRFFVEGRNRYEEIMKVELKAIAELVADQLTKAKDRIREGREEVKAYVEKLPDNLKKIGQDAAEEVQSKFDSLQEDVNSKQDELVDSLAQKYKEGLDAVDAKIEKMKAANRGLVGMALDAVAGVIKTILNIKNMLMSLLASAMDVIKAIIADPIGFLGNLISGLLQGLQNFLGNILSHLQSGLIGWLTGALGPMGITIPDNLFSLKGIFSLLTQILGVTKEFFLARARKLLGDKVVDAILQGFEMFKILATEGVTGLWNYVKEKFNDLKTTIMDAIKEMVISTVINAGIKWIIGLMSPAGAFVKAAMMIIDIVKFFINRGSQILALVKAFIDGVKAVASGNVGKIAAAIENALKMALPIVIGFLANLLGIGGLARKVTSIIKKIRRRITKAIDSLIKKAKKWFGKMFGKGKKKRGEKKIKESSEINSPKEVKDKAGRYLSSKLKNIESAQVPAVLKGTLRKFKKEGLKSLETKTSESGEIELFASASQAERKAKGKLKVPKLYVGDLQLGFGTVLVATLNGVPVPPNGRFEAESESHAEDNLAEAVRENWDSLKKEGTNPLVVRITRSPCDRCGPTLGNLKRILNKNPKYQVAVTLKMMSDYKGSNNRETNMDVFENLRNEGINIEIWNVLSRRELKRFGIDPKKIKRENKEKIKKRVEAVRKLIIASRKKVTN